MTDRELLELAAKAAGIELFYRGTDGYDRKVIDGQAIYRRDGASLFPWCPLTDDGDALRLAVKLDMNVEVAGKWVYACGFCGNCSEHVGEDRQAATRRAITRAAAEVGRTKP